MVDINVSTLTPRTSLANLRMVAYDFVSDSFAVAPPSLLTGQAGPQGIQGPTGPQGIQGVPGAAGTNGTKLIVGTVAPVSADGVNGDSWINKTTMTFYGPKANGAWPAGVSLIGPQGPQGIQGPAGTSGSGGTTANLDNGTVDGQVAVWNQALGKYQPVTGTAITGDRSPTVELNAGTALTFALHNRRNIVLSALANLTLAASEVGTSPNQGFEATVNNDHTAINQISFGSGITVQQPAAGTGTGGVVKIAVNGVIAIQIYPKGAGLIAKVRGDVA